MKQSTINRIIKNYEEGKNTYIGNYVYKLQWHPMAGKTFIVRCKREDENREWISWDGIIVNGWEWLKPLI